MAHFLLPPTALAYQGNAVNSRIVSTVLSAISLCAA
jgi:hypothetical protein